jgi:hypothetical protein
VEARVRKDIVKDDGLEALLQDEFDTIVARRKTIREGVFRNPIGRKHLHSKVPASVEMFLPVNVPRLLVNIKRRFKSRKVRQPVSGIVLASIRNSTEQQILTRCVDKAQVLSDLNPRYVVERVSQMIDTIANIPKHASPYMAEALREDKLLYDLVFRMHLSSKQVLDYHRLTRQMFDYAVVAIESAFETCAIAPGEMVGVIAAQSLGQPTTQMVLSK